MKKKEKLFIIGILLLAGVGYLIIHYMKPESTQSVVINVSGETFGRYSLDEDQVIEINDTNVAEIKDGQIRMIEAKCPDQLCILQGPFGKSGGFIVCLPNEIIIEGANIENGDGKLQLDSIAK